MMSSFFQGTLAWLPNNYARLPQSSFESEEPEHDLKIERPPRAPHHPWTTPTFTLSLVLNLLLATLCLYLFAGWERKSESHSPSP